MQILIMIGGESQAKVYGSRKGTTNTSKRMGQSTNGPIKRLGHSISGIKRFGHTTGSGGGKKKNSEIYPRFKDDLDLQQQ